MERVLELMCLLLICPGFFCLPVQYIEVETVNLLPCAHGANTSCIEYDNRGTEAVYPGQNITVTIISLILDKATLQEIFSDENKLALVSINDDITRGYWIKSDYSDRWSIQYHFTPSANGWGRITTGITVQNTMYVDEILFHLEVRAKNSTFKTGGNALFRVLQEKKKNNSTPQPENNVTPDDGRQEEDWQEKLIQCQATYNRHLETHNNAVPTSGSASNMPNNVEIVICFTCILLVAGLCINLFGTFFWKSTPGNWTMTDERQSLELQQVSIETTANGTRQCMDVTVPAGHNAMIERSRSGESNPLLVKYHMHLTHSKTTYNAA